MVVSIPLRYMHSPVEMVSLKDIARAGRLLAEFAIHLEAGFMDRLTWDEESSAWRPELPVRLPSAAFRRGADPAAGAAVQRLRGLWKRGEVRKIVLEQVKPYASELRVDALGNVLAVRRGQASQPLRVMAAAHMDEVG